MCDKPNTIDMTSKQIQRFFNYAFGDDLDFYEEHTMHLTDEEQEKFFKDNPEFMSKYSITQDYIYLLKDKIYRGILRKIDKYNKS